MFEGYGLTEVHGFVAVECHEHAGLHIDEDAVIVEVVDDQARVLPPGGQGDGVLLTSLLNETLPIIRYRVDDLMSIDEAPCACGVPFARIVSIEGRREEELQIRRVSGGVVGVRPSVIEGVLEATPEVRRFQLRNGHDECEVLRGGPRNSDRLLRWDPDHREGVWNVPKETELPG